MSIQRLFTRRLLGPGEVPASRDDFEVVGVFNPGAVRVDGEVILLVRVVERPLHKREGFTGLPRWDPISGLTIDWIPVAELVPIDPRVVRRKSDGLVRLTFISHLRVIRCGDGRQIREVTDITFRPSLQFEEFGVEDPRITALNGRFYFTYVAVSRHGPATALASTSNFREFERHGVIFCPENKDVVLFPEMIGSDYVAMHRPVCLTPFTRPEIWLARSPDLLHWGDHEPLRLATSAWQSGRVGAGPPPIRVPEGWLAIYHGNRQPKEPGEVGEYAAGLILLEGNDPARVLGQTSEPFMRPEEAFEKVGFVADVVFPTGIVEAGDEVLIYYGAADAVTAVVGYARDDLVEAVEN